MFMSFRYLHELSCFLNAVNKGRINSCEVILVLFCSVFYVNRDTAPDYIDAYGKIF